MIKESFTNGGFVMNLSDIYGMPDCTYTFIAAIGLDGGKLPSSFVLKPSARANEHVWDQQYLVTWTAHLVHETSRAM